MRTILNLGTAIILAFNSSLSYSLESPDHILRTVEVVGYAEIEVNADQAKLQFFLREYDKGFPGAMTQEESTSPYESDMVSLRSIENDLFKLLSKYGINKTVAKISSDLTTLPHMSSNIGTEIIEIPISEISKIPDISQEALKVRGIETAQVTDKKCKEAEKYENQAILNAMSMAKEKALFLANSYGKKLGDVVEVSEIPEEHFVIPDYYDKPVKIVFHYKMKVRFEMN